MKPIVDVIRAMLAVLLLLAAATLSISSCEKTDSPKEKPKQVAKDVDPPITRFRTVLASLNIADQKAIFNGLSPEIRSAVWKDRIAGAMGTSNTDEQNNALRKIHDAINPDLYRDTQPSLDSITALIDAAYQSFGPDSTKLDGLFTTLGEENQAPSLAGAKAARAPAPDCNCNQGRNGALRANDCGPLSKACADAECIQSRWGCGIAFLQQCDGICKQPSPTPTPSPQASPQPQP